MSTGGDDWYQKYLARQERERQHSEKLAQYILPVLRFLQVQKVAVPFDGSGDEGWTQPPTFDGLEANATEAGHLFGSVAGLIPLGLDKFLQHACELALPSGWEINAGSLGTWTIDVVEGKTNLDHIWRDDEDDLDEEFDDDDFEDDEEME
jgi:hypothetical protein